MSEEDKNKVEETNEFEDLGVSEEVPTTTADEDSVSATPDSQEDLIAEGNSGTVYDYTKAPQVTKAPPREDLDGKTVTIKKAEIVLPSADSPWKKTRDGSKDVKYCIFRLTYDVDGQQEFYSGIRVFNREGKYSHPSIMNDGKSQASALKKAYADFKGMNIAEVTIPDFMSFLNGNPKAEIKAIEFENPETGAKVKKNIVVKFVQ